jgi:hypothetical protein
MRTGKPLAERTASLEGEPPLARRCTELAEVMAGGTPNSLSCSYSFSLSYCLYIIFSRLFFNYPETFTKEQV